MKENFDYIIVGAGSAGCVLANKLSENQKSSVLLLEAGGKDNNLFIHMPSGYSQIVPKASKQNYGFETEPETNTAERKLYWPRGRGWGGSSSINAMIYTRGHSSDYDHWRQLGNPGWSYDDVLPYFKRAENYEGDGDREFHGKNGPLNVKKSDRDDDILLDKFVEAGAQAGFPLTNDFNGKQQEGFSRYEHTIKGSKRFSSARAYLHPALKRKNLFTKINITVDKVIFENRKAIGIEYFEKGSKKFIGCNREVILSSGAVNSPQILLRSGIGDAKEIKKHGINVTHELKGVGKNLQDHFAVVSQFACTQPVTLHRSASFLKTMIAGIKYLTTGTGDASNPPCVGGAFIKSQPNKEIPDIQIHYVSLAMQDVHGRAGVPQEHGFSNLVYLCRPQSKGYITLKSSDPNDDPLMYPNYFSVEQDLIDTRNGLREARRVFMQPVFDEYRGEELKPEKNIDINNDHELDQWIRETGETLYHPVGTCKMGIDEFAVTNEHGQVHGTESLRVVDASLMPSLIAGNTNAPTIMMAEKISDHINGNSFLG
ncbi:MAG: choline dehydrogenase [Rhizobiales bacterium TMED168]|nr:MAG: choline dehydrogenase [Rhizobiales bacterium TMED168]|tara:strand:- start:996 stop:2618 length:1623 start_codon:yes stop_codon:yes gene_type:complete